MGARRFRIFAFGLICFISALNSFAVKPKAVGKGQEAPKRGMSKAFWNADPETLRRGYQWVSIGAGPMFNDFLRGGRNPPSGSADTGSPLTVPIAVEGGIAFSKLFKFSPSILYTPFPRKSAGKDTTVKNLFFSTRLVYQFARIPTQIHLGPGIWMSTTTGKGEKITTQNGTGTAEFYSPGSTATTRLAYLMVGLTQSIRRFHVDLDVYLPGLFSQRRMVDLAVGLGYDVF